MLAILRKINVSITSKTYQEMEIATTELQLPPTSSLVQPLSSPSLLTAPPLIRPSSRVTKAPDRLCLLSAVYPFYVSHSYKQTVERVECCERGAQSVRTQSNMGHGTISFRSSNGGL